ncbi:hypothetical protein [Streptomyces griseorubiginosus]|uniref:hypothetical protein n=1 Tax=Streptomyces griseorubiginosus TaxID=67304 RepID=UPI00331AB7DF
MPKKSNEPPGRGAPDASGLGQIERQQPEADQLPQHPPFLNLAGDEPGPRTDADVIRESIDLGFSFNKLWFGWRSQTVAGSGLNRATAVGVLAIISILPAGVAFWACRAADAWTWVQVTVPLALYGGIMFLALRKPTNR